MLSPTGVTTWLLLFCVLSSVAAKFDWCKITCPKKKARHTMCDYKAGGGDACKTWTHGLTAEEKQVILDHHNMLRDKIASGRETRGVGGGPEPKAANMMELVWDYEAEEIAQRWTDQCHIEGHDKCRTASDGKYTGQNFARRGWTGKCMERKEVMRMLVQDWYDEIDMFKKCDIDQVFKESNASEVGHFTQLVWAKTTRIGCGFSYYQEGEIGKSVFRMYCNYKEGGNYRRREIYKRAVVRPGESCPGGTSKRFSSLCKPQFTGDRLTNSIRERLEAPALSPESQQAEDFKASQNMQFGDKLLEGFPVQEGQQTHQFSFSSTMGQDQMGQLKQQFPQLQVGGQAQQFSFSSSDGSGQDQLETLMKQFPQLHGIPQGSHGSVTVKVYKKSSSTSNTQLSPQQIKDMMSSQTQSFQMPA